MKFYSSLTCLMLALALLLPACASPQHTNEPATKEDIRENAKRLAKQTDRIDVVPNDPNCVDSDIRGGAVRVRTCIVHNLSTATDSGYLNYEMATPQVTTVVQTDKATFGNPMAWSVEVRRNGELIVSQALTTEGQEIIEREGSFAVESYFELGSKEIQPGEYEVIITPDEEGAEPIRSVIQVPEPDDAQELDDTPQNNISE